MPENPQIYNSRIIKSYSAYLRERHPDVQIDIVLHWAGIAKHELEDPGHWFNQQQVDRFQEKAVELTGNPAISREAGQYAVMSNAAGPVKQYALGLLEVSSAYLLLSKLYGLMSRGATVSSRKLKANQVEIDVVPAPGVEEKPFQCENRIGFFEALSAIYTRKFATIDHPECVHRGDDRCRYVASWEASSLHRWKRFFASILGIGALLLMIAVAVLPWEIWMHLLSVWAMGAMGIYLWAQRLERRDLVHVIQHQSNAAENQIREIDYRYQGSRLIQKIGQATSTRMDVAQLARIVVDNIQAYLDFDRGMIMLADKDQKCLHYAAGFGFEETMADMLKKTRFRLDQPEAKGIFIRVFKKQEPVLVDDVDALRSTFSPKSRQLVDQIGSKSLICLPIVHEGISLGILAVDNVVTKHPLSKSDINLLMGVAYQTAVSLFSVQSFKRLQNSEERFRSLYESAPTAYISIRIEDAVIVNCNAAAIRLFGHERQKLIGSSLLGHVASDKENQRRSQWMHEKLMSGQSFHNETLGLIDSQGRSRWVHVSLEPFKSSTGKMVEGRCILIDITEQKHLEEKLQRAQRMETIGTLAGGVAHDLSNILAAIVSYPDLLLMDIQKDSPLYNPLVKIKSAGNRAAAIVQDLLTLSRRGVPISDVVDLNEMVALFLNSPEFDDLMARHPAIRVQSELSPKEVLLEGSPVHLTKTLMNIVFNAAEAIVDSGGIRITTEKRWHTPKDQEPGHYAVLSVVDDGHGMSPEDLKRVFEPFFTKKMMGKSGTGLGMAIVWAAVKDHSGFVDIDSQVGQGTTVRLFFPATQKKRRSAMISDDPAQYGGDDNSVLIVDDDIEHREIANRMLTRLGYDVVAVETGEAAVEKFKNAYRPDIVILDMILGQGLDGLETYQHILKFRPGQKAIIVSGYSESSRVQRARGLGVGAFVKKPYSLKEIAGAVRKEIDRHPAENA